MVLYRIAVLSTLCSLGLSTSLQASPEQPNRVGVNINYLYAQGACESQAVSCDDSDIGWSLFYERDLFDKWILGAAYSDLGEYKATYPAASGEDSLAFYKGKVSGPEIYAGYRFPLADKHEIVARAGALFWQVKNSGVEPDFNVSTKETGISPTLGLAYAWDMSSNFTLNLGYQILLDVGADDTGGSKINRFTAGVAYRFGAEKKKPIIVKTVKSKPQIRVVKKIVVEKSMIYALDTTNSLVLFEHDNYRLMPEMEKELQPMLARLKKFKEAHLKISSHTDSTGTTDYNQKLSERRADFIKAFFVENGIDASRIQTQAMGETEQAFDNSTAENRAMNRRVVLFSPSFEREK